MKTYSPKPEHIERRWFVVDASGQVLGRLASEVATLLRGKHKPMYAPHMDTGDHVIVVNADKIEVTGNKGEDKYAYHHSGYPGGIRAIQYKDLLTQRPVAAVEKAVRGMLPKNTLGRQMIKKLHVVPGAEHPHQAQSPVAIAVGERPAWGGLPTPAPTVRKATAPKRPKPAADDDAAEATSKAKPKTTTAKRKTATSKPKTTSAKRKAATTKAKTTATSQKSAATSSAKKRTTKKPAKTEE